jgi:hypothetical protein
MFFNRADVPRDLVVSPYASFELSWYSLSLGLPSVANEDPIAALHALMALCGVARVEVKP